MDGGIPFLRERQRDQLHTIHPIHRVSGSSPTLSLLTKESGEQHGHDMGHHTGHDGCIGAVMVMGGEERLPKLQLSCRDEDVPCCRGTRLGQSAGRDE